MNHWNAIEKHLKPQKTIYMVVGAPGSGKTWVTNQLKDKFELIHHDGYIHLKEPGSYVKAILSEAPKATKPVLIEAPFSVSQTQKPLEDAGYKVIPVFITEDPKTHSARYFDREKKPIPQGHLTRTNTYASRAKDGGFFHGTSQQVLEHLLKLNV